MLMPKRTKYRKSHRLSYEGKAKGNLTLNNGEFGLMAMEGGWISARQIEAARIAMTRYMKRGGKVYINIFPHMPRTRKPLETRQGKGKVSTKTIIVLSFLSLTTLPINSCFAFSIIFHHPFLFLLIQF